MAAIAGGASVKVACERGPISRSYVYRLKKAKTPTGERFRREFHDAEERFRRGERARGARLLAVG